MGPNVVQLVTRYTASARSQHERDVIRALRRSRDRGNLSTMYNAAVADTNARIAAVRADPRDPFHSADDEAIAAEILRRLGPGGNS